MAGVTPDVRLLQAAQTGDLASAGAALAAGANLECTDSQARAGAGVDGGRPASEPRRRVCVARPPLPAAAPPLLRPRARGAAPSPLAASAAAAERFPQPDASPAAPPSVHSTLPPPPSSLLTRPPTTARRSSPPLPQFRKTPLALAVKFGQPDVARLLVQCGADTSLVQTGNPEVAAVLHETPPILARNAPLALWLRKVGLASFRHALVCRLGVAGVDDLLRLTEADLEAVGMKVAERRRFLAEAAKGRSAPAGPHADWTKEQVGAWLESEAFGDCVAALAPLRGLSLRGLTDEDLAQLRYPPIPRAVRRELLAAIAALP